MPSGGARARSGPPPDPNALRRERDSREWTVLPAAGREGDPPPWPLSRPNARKLDLWAELWRRPEAVMWEANDQALQVALYVLAVLAADRPRATASDRKAALSFMDDLGLSNGGRAKNRWVIDDPRATEREPAATSAPAAAGRSQLLELVVDNRPA